MNQVYRLLPLALVAGALLATPAGAQTSTGTASTTTAELKVGDQAPDFTLQATDDKTYTLGNLKGHWVVLAWFPKAFTAG